MLRGKHTLAFIFFCLLILATSSWRVSATSAQVLADPLAAIVSIGDTFNVNFTVTNIAHFTCWQVSLYYLNSVLNCSAVFEGPFLKAAGNTYFIKNITNNFNNTYGCVRAACTLLGMVSANGNGVLATFTFKALAAGSTKLHFDEVILGDENIPPQPIAHSTTDGTVMSIGANPDVAVTSVTSYRSIVGKGFSENITSTVENHGRFAETFNVTLIAASTAIGTREVDNLPSGKSIFLTFAWNTSGTVYGNYTVGTVADTVPGETNTGDNTLTGGWVTVTIPGDLTGDFKVGLKDLVLLANAYNSHPGNAKWNPTADIDGNGVAGLADLVILAQHYGQHFP